MRSRSHFGECYFNQFVYETFQFPNSKTDNREET